MSVGVNIIHSICCTLRATFNHGPTMYIVDVIGDRVSLLRSVCVAKAAVGVAGQCLVRPELTFEYLTRGTRYYLEHNIGHVRVTRHRGG